MNRDQNETECMIIVLPRADCGIMQMNELLLAKINTLTISSDTNRLGYYFVLWATVTQEFQKGIILSKLFNLVTNASTNERCGYPLNMASLVSTLVFSPTSFWLLAVCKNVFCMLKTGWWEGLRTKLVMRMCCYLHPQTAVMLNFYSTSRSAQYFEDPLTFKPERWSREESSELTPFSNLPFGFGPRSCYGEFEPINTVAPALLFWEVGSCYIFSNLRSSSQSRCKGKPIVKVIL